ncbi:MAG: hypothetical protein QW165_01580 [Candidatus Woesearchaeota archaeon]
MRKRYWLLLFIIACTQQPQLTSEPTPAATPIQVLQTTIRDAKLLENINAHIINKPIEAFMPVLTDAVRDKFGIIPVERYDARYQAADTTVLVQIFKFSTRAELNLVLKSELYDIVNKGISRHQGHLIAIYLTVDDHRSALWSSGTTLVYVETFRPDFVEREIVEAYLIKYPSDLVPDRCIDSDGNDRYLKGTTTRVKIGTNFTQWTDVCLKDITFEYIARQGIPRENGLLEGVCDKDSYKAGYIAEYLCVKGCQDGACVVR